jgi:RNA polymerase sigma-70 factor (ECF subfamily)
LQYQDTNENIKNIIADGNVSAFTILYNSFFKRLLLEAFKYVDDVAAAEEIVQDVFLRIWERSNTLNGITSIKSYLYRSVINESLNYIRRKKSIELHHQILAENLTDSYIQEVDEEHELVLKLYAQIDKLPAKCKQVFKMARLDGLRYREIAEKLSISERTVENHVANALKLLKENMGEKSIDKTILFRAISLFNFF